MTTDESEAAVRRFIAALGSGGNLDDLDVVCSSEVARSWRSNMEQFSFTDRTFRIDDLVTDDAKVAILLTNTGTHISSYAGIPATGRHTSVHGSAFFTFNEGKITNVISYFDAEDLFQQLGATVNPPG